MPRSLYAWYSLNGLEVLGQREVLLTGEIEIKRLTRFRELLHSDRGSVRVEFKFGQQASAYTTVRLEYATSFRLQCQRCLEPMEERVVRHASFVVVGSESIPAGVPEDYEPIALTDDRFQPASFMEDELIVSLPLVPRHARIEQCGALARSLQAPENESGVESTNSSLASHRGELKNGSPKKP